tara:strand:- start:2653 stop:3258 length:606 start_codon:yes stop_codon:yes gene_type:complete
MVKVAGYIYGYNKKKSASFPFNEISNYLLGKAKEKNVGVDEIYADGYVEIPQGLEELLDEIHKFDAVILYSLEGLTIDDINKMSKKQLYCVTVPWITGKNAANELSKIIKSKEYYDEIRSLTIRWGMVMSEKDSGAAPFGYQYNQFGKLEENMSQMETIRQVVSWRKQGKGVPEICQLTELKPLVVYRILRKWSDKVGNLV